MSNAVKWKRLKAKIAVASGCGACSGPVASGVYFVQELIVAFVLFVLGFLTMALVILGLYLLRKGRKWHSRVSPIGINWLQGMQTRGSMREPRGNAASH